MIIHAIEVQNWGCIDHATLDGLSPGVNILHGPNRSGKSTLLRAVRACLFDFDHDSTARQIRDAIPRGSNAIPVVKVQFEVAGGLYRLSKTYSKSVNGGAHLEKRSGGEWRTVAADPKEASTRARELLGLGKSDEGLNLLLWVSQGDVELPSALDGKVEEQLTGILGSITTGSDLKFRKVLQQKLSNWFTPGGHPSRNSPVVQLEKRQAELALRLAEFERNLTAREGLVRSYDDSSATIEESSQEVGQSQEEVHRLESDSAAARERIKAHQQATSELELAAAEVARCRLAVASHEEAGQRLREAQNALKAAQDAVDAATKEVEAHFEHLSKAKGDLQAVRALLKAHSDKQVDLKDRRTLVECKSNLAELAEKLEAIGRLEEEIERLEGYLAGPAAPSAAELAELRKNWERMQTIEAQLAASALRLSISAEAEIAGAFVADSGSDENLALTSGQTFERQARQHLRLSLGGVGSIEIRRGKQDGNVEELARELDDLRLGFDDAVVTYEVEIGGGTALDELTERRYQREAWEKGLVENRTKLDNLAPEGVAALKSHEKTFEQRRAAVLERCPELAEWEPHSEELREMEEQHDVGKERLEGELIAADTAVNKADADCTEKKEGRSRAKEELARCKAVATATQGELGRAGDSKSLVERLEVADNAVVVAEKRVTETALTEDEQTFDERLEQAQQALERRRKRLDDAKKERDQLFGELRAGEGLHAQRVDIEQCLNDVQVKLALQREDLAAHELLMKTFDDCRDARVDRTMGPISARVVEWAKRLGLDEYSGLAYDDKNYLPTGLMAVRSLEEDEPAPLNSESYGTVEQLALLVRLALGGLLAQNEPQVAILDDPLAHSDTSKHRRMLNIIKESSEGSPASNDGETTFGSLQIFVLTCHPERFDHLKGANHVQFRPTAGRSE